jgi:hypothetical protein
VSESRFGACSSSWGFGGTSGGALTRVVDRWRHHTDEAVDPLDVHRHQSTVAVARELGYDVQDVDLGALSARYRGRPDPGLDRIGRFERTGM